MTKPEIAPAIQSALAAFDIASAGAVEGAVSIEERPRSWRIVCAGLTRSDAWKVKVAVKHHLMAAFPGEAFWHSHKGTNADGKSIRYWYTYFPAAGPWQNHGGVRGMACGIEWRDYKLAANGAPAKED